MSQRIVVPELSRGSSLRCRNVINVLVAGMNIERERGDIGSLVFSNFCSII